MMQPEQVEEEFKSRPFATVLLGFWFFLLLPWAPFAFLAGMAGEDLTGEIFKWSMWTYPISLWIAVKFRKTILLLVLLPCVNVAGVLLTGFRK
jgi:hypothetical protein